MPRNAFLWPLCCGAYWGAYSASPDVLHYIVLKPLIFFCNFWNLKLLVLTDCGFVCSLNITSPAQCAVAPVKRNFRFWKNLLRYNLCICGMGLVYFVLQVSKAPFLSCHNLALCNGNPAQFGQVFSWKYVCYTFTCKPKKIFKNKQGTSLLGNIVIKCRVITITWRCYERFDYLDFLASLCISKPSEDGSQRNGGGDYISQHFLHDR